MTDREEREKHLRILEGLLKALKGCISVIPTEERIKAVKYAISSIKTDLAYDLEYEKISFITLNELKDIREEIARYTFFLSLSKERSAIGQVEWSGYLIKESDVLEILDKKISELESKE